MAIRNELVADDPDYIWWIGDGTKDSVNDGLFSISNTGDAHFGGALSAGVIFVAVQNPKFGNLGLSVDTEAIPSNGGPRLVTFSFHYSNEGTTSSNLTEDISATISLGRIAANGGWTPLASNTFDGRITSTGSGSSWNTRVHLSGSVTFSDNNSAPAPRYRVTLGASTGNWPLTIGGSRGRQRLGVSSLEV